MPPSCHSVKYTLDADYVPDPQVGDTVVTGIHSPKEATEEDEQLLYTAAKC